MVKTKTNHKPVPPHLLQILPVNNANSDGTGAQCPQPGVYNTDAYLLREIAHMWCSDPTSQHNFQPGMTPELSNLPTGYTSFAVPRNPPASRQNATRSQNWKNRLIYGHPKGSFRAATDFYDHFKYMQEQNTVSGCPCGNCSLQKNATTKQRAQDRKNARAAQVQQQQLQQQQAAQTAQAAAQAALQAQQMFQPWQQYQQPAHLQNPLNPQPQPTAPNVVQLPPPASSDGTGIGCNVPGTVRNDDHYLKAFGKYHAQVQNLPQHQTYKLSSMPAGYSGWIRVLNGLKQYWIAGHPTGQMFRSVPEFYDHVLFLNLHGLPGPGNACPCCICARRPRSPGEGVRYAGQGQAAAAAAAPQGNQMAAMQPVATAPAAVPQVNTAVMGQPMMQQPPATQQPTFQAPGMMAPTMQPPMQSAAPAQAQTGMISRADPFSLFRDDNGYRQQSTHQMPADVTEQIAAAAAASQPTDNLPFGLGAIADFNRQTDEDAEQTQQQNTNGTEQDTYRYGLIGGQAFDAAQTTNDWLDPQLATGNIQYATTNARGANDAFATNAANTPTPATQNPPCQGCGSQHRPDPQWCPLTHGYDPSWQGVCPFCGELHHPFLGCQMD